MDIENLTTEQIEKAKLCQTAEDFVAFAEREGIELTDEELDTVSGGAYWDSKDETKTDSGVCPYCHNNIVWFVPDGRPRHCPFCGMTLLYRD